ncbi:helix-turn-helix domain-containing protein [Actinomadura bangladeshensis]
MGLSLTQCGEIIGAARSTVSNLEAGRRRPQDDQMRLLDRAYGTGLLFQVLLWFARMAHDPDWGRQIDKYEEEASRSRPTTARSSRLLSRRTTTHGPASGRVNSRTWTPP